MTHLADGELRRLVDDGPDAAAGAHLAACPSCSARRDTLAETAAATRAALGAAPAAETLNAGSAHAVVRARILAQPPSREQASPCRTAFSTSGCRINWGTNTGPVSASIDHSTFRRVPRRVASRSNCIYFASNWS